MNGQPEVRKLQRAQTASEEASTRGALLGISMDGWLFVCYYDWHKPRPGRGTWSIQINWQTAWAAGDSVRNTLREDLSVTLQAEPYDVDEWPLCVALEKVCPYLQNGEAQASGVIGRLGFLVIKVYYRVGFRNDAPDPVQYSIFAIFRLVSMIPFAGSPGRSRLDLPVMGTFMDSFSELSHLLSSTAHSSPERECRTLQKKAWLRATLSIPNLTGTLNACAA